MNYIRIWDRISAERVDHFIANSNFVAKRIKKYYRKESAVIHPPVNVAKFHTSSEQGDYFLIVGRMLAYKKNDIAIKAFNQLGLKLKIIGRGPDYKRLKKMAKDNIEFTGRLSDEDLARTYARARAFIFPQEEDAGITPLEAMACGRPVIAFGGGGALESIVDGKTGVLFKEQTVVSLSDAIKRSQKISFDPKAIRRHAEGFDKEIFKKEILEYIKSKI